MVWWVNTKMLTIIFAAVCSFAIIILIAWVWRKSAFHIAVAFGLFAIVDVYFPAAYWAMFGQVNNPEWATPLRNYEILNALVFYSIFFLIFIFCVIGVSFKVYKSNPINHFFTQKFEIKLLNALFAFLILVLIKIKFEITIFGGVEPWFWSRMVLTVPDSVDSSTVAGRDFFAALPVREVFQALVGLGFYFRQHARHTRLFTYVFPAFAIILAMTTFLRGAVLACLITLIFAEFLRRQAQLRPSTSERLSLLKPITMVLIAGLLSIFLYGAVRDGFRGEVSVNHDTEISLTMPTFVTAGHGLFGVSHVLAEYGQSVSFLGGRTYIDMLLLPIPRSIYPSKPAWYGIDDITRGMGWPDTTQSAVTMPGEAFANFGIFGLLVSIPLGIFFGLLQNVIRVNEIRYLMLGPIFFFQMASVANWMAFTGIMNSLITLALLFVVASYIRCGQILCYTRSRY